MRQKNGETVKDFGGRLEGSAQLCDFQKSSKIRCSCGCNLSQDVSISYREDMIMSQLILGLSNTEWQEKALAFGNDKTTLDDVNRFLNSLEAARDAREAIGKESEVAGLKSTEYKKSKNPPSFNKPKPEDNKNEDNKNCRACGSRDHNSSTNSRRKNCPAFQKECTRCHRIGHFAKFCLSKMKKEKEVASTETENGDLTSFGVFLGVEIANNASDKHIVPHFGYDKIHGWIPSSFEEHGRRRVRITPCFEGYEAVGDKIPEDSRKCKQEAVVDSGAMMTLGEQNLLKKLNMEKKDLIKTSLDIKAANKASINILGGVFAKIETLTNDDEVETSTKQLIYI